MDLKRLFLLAGLLVAAPLATPAIAGTQASTLSIAAEVPNGCTVSASPMNFGMVTGTITAVRTTSQVQLDCAPRLDYVITLDRGLNAQGRQRRMANAAGTRFLRYNIYNDAGYSREWDDRGGSRRVSGNSGTTGHVSHTAYGEIPVLASLLAVGPYTDTVVVTVEF